MRARTRWQFQRGWDQNYFQFGVPTRYSKIFSTHQEGDVACSLIRRVDVGCSSSTYTFLCLAKLHDTDYLLNTFAFQPVAQVGDLPLC